MARVIGEVRPRFAFMENSPLLVRRGLTTVLSDLAEMGYDARWCVLGADDVGAPHRRKRIWILATNDQDGHVADSDSPGCQRPRPAQPKGRLDPAEPLGCRADVADTSEPRLQGPARSGVPGPRGSSVESARSRANVANAVLYRRHTRRPSDAPEVAGGWQPDRGGEQPDLPDADEQYDDDGGYGTGSDCGICDECPEADLCRGQRGWWDSEPSVGRVAPRNPDGLDISRLKALGNAQVPAVAALAWKILSEVDDG